MSKYLSTIAEVSIPEDIPTGFQIKGDLRMEITVHWTVRDGKDASIVSEWDETSYLDARTDRDVDDINIKSDRVYYIQASVEM
ncbi:hypothetical protein LCGC14_0397010 [marine sediment metagenome]|uniref:Uncharacterized protein n=1 Tax=marine sediment metagenome TaxID=412755 RepID=A0A0F9W6T3_9ZZZZ